MTFVAEIRSTLTASRLVLKMAHIRSTVSYTNRRTKPGTSCLKLMPSNIE